MFQKVVNQIQNASSRLRRNALVKKLIDTMRPPTRENEPEKLARLKAIAMLFENENYSTEELEILTNIQSLLKKPKRRESDAIEVFKKWLLSGI